MNLLFGIIQKKTTELLLNDEMEKYLSFSNNCCE